MGSKPRQPKRLDLLFVEAALRPDGDRSTSPSQGAAGAIRGAGLEQQTRRSGRQRAQVLEQSARHLDGRKTISPALLASVHRDRAPVRGLRFRLRGLQAYHAAAALDGDDARDAEFGRSSAR